MNKKYGPIWDVGRAREFYNISVWGEGYFDINPLGHVVAIADGHNQIDLSEVIRKLSQQGVSLPILVRFPQILQARVKELTLAFELAAKKSRFAIEHIPFYPLKVNQQSEVAKHILSTDIPVIGLEVGTKTELLAALALLDTDHAMLICNGYKDRSYIRLALYAQDMGIETCLVVEKLSELIVILEESKHLHIKPELGVRIRLNTIAAGKWQNSGGKEAKFGLSAGELIDFLAILEGQEAVDQLKVLHFHMGSQISNVKDFRCGLLEALCVYRALHEQGFNIEKIDIGGGLAVDYSSQQDTSYFSKSYSLQDYADIVVTTIGEYCSCQQLPLPQLLSENGRALSAHHAVLISNVVEAEPAHTPVSDPLHSLNNTGQKLLQEMNLSGTEQAISIQKYDSCLRRCGESFTSGEISLQERAVIETYLRACLAEPEQRQKYYVNLSVFQSLPDTWGLGQIFPIMPLENLHIEPANEVILQDLTCDSDGHIDSYACDGKLSSSIRLHAIKNDQHYLLGFFLVGAYQEVLGDLHNLFGDTHAVNVKLGGNQELILTEFETGDSVQELLTFVHIDCEQVMLRCKQRMSNANNLTSEKRLAEIKDALYGYSYLDSMNRPAHRIKD